MSLDVRLFFILRKNLSLPRIFYFALLEKDTGKRFDMLENF